jgi:hypothetical protein
MYWLNMFNEDYVYMRNTEKSSCLDWDEDYTSSNSIG